MADGKALAIQEAERQGCATDIVLATIEAETNFTNKTGDNGNALGYGQVWPRWHMASFQAAGQMLGIPVPTDMASLTALTLSNDQFSMAVAVHVIKRNWQAAKGDWAQFTYIYVGPQIPLSDFKRRQNIWNKYSNSNFDYTGQAQDQASGGGIASVDGTKYNIKIPETTNAVVAGSAAFGDVLYGRRYRVFVADLKGDFALDVSELRCTFNCVKNIQEANYSEVVIYNLSPEKESAIIKEGYRVVIEAGYEGSQYGLIFDGNVVWPMRDKEAGTTYKLTLVSIDADMFNAYGVANFSVARGQNSRDFINHIANTASVPIELGRISQNLSEVRLTRGKVVFGKAADYLRQLAISNSGTFYLEDGKVNIIKAEDYREGEIIDLTPETGLIGVPIQNDYGATIKMLLNPRVKIGSFIHVDNSLIRNRQFTPGQGVPPVFDQDGIYRVIKLTHKGDTRGNDWYTEVETVTQAGRDIPSMMPFVGANPF